MEAKLHTRGCRWAEPGQKILLKFMMVTLGGGRQEDEANDPKSIFSENPFRFVPKTTIFAKGIRLPPKKDILASREFLPSVKYTEESLQIYRK